MYAAENNTMKQSDLATATDRKVQQSEPRNPIMAGGGAGRFGQISRALLYLRCLSLPLLVSRCLSARRSAFVCSALQSITYPRPAWQRLALACLTNQGKASHRGT